MTVDSLATGALPDAGSAGLASAELYDDPPDLDRRCPRKRR